MRRLLFVSLCLVMGARSAWAQPPTPNAGTFEAFALAGPGQMWDDEGYLGTAVVGGVGVGYRVGHFGVEGVFDRRRHQPDFGNDVVIRAEATRVTGRLLYYFGRRRVQPYAGGTVGFTFVDRFSAFPDDCRFVDHEFVCSSTREFQSTDRGRALSALAGVRFQSGRWFVRPEFELGKSGNDLTMAGTVAVGFGW
jgi:hypothetical protein